MEPLPTRDHDPGRGPLLGWLALATSLALISYAARAGDTSTDDTRELLYHYGTAVGGLVQYGIMLGILALIARHIDRRTLGLVAPASWRRAAGLIAVAIVAAWVIGAVLNIFLKAGEEQGLTPDRREPDRAGRSS